MLSPNRQNLFAVYVLYVLVNDCNARPPVENKANVPEEIATEVIFITLLVAFGFSIILLVSLFTLGGFLKRFRSDPDYRSETIDKVTRYLDYWHLRKTAARLRERYKEPDIQIKITPPSAQSTTASSETAHPGENRVSPETTTLPDDGPGIPVVAEILNDIIRANNCTTEVDSSEPEADQQPDDTTNLDESDLNAKNMALSQSIKATKVIVTSGHNEIIDFTPVENAPQKSAKDEDFAKDAPSPSVGETSPSRPGTRRGRMNLNSASAASDGTLSQRSSRNSPTLSSVTQAILEMEEENDDLVNNSIRMAQPTSNINTTPAPNNNSIYGPPADAVS